jgi:hypothetical protein
VAKARLAAINGSDVPQSKRTGIPARAEARAKTSCARKSSRLSKAPGALAPGEVHSAELIPPTAPTTAAPWRMASHSAP